MLPLNYYIWLIVKTTLDLVCQTGLTCFLKTGSTSWTKRATRRDKDWRGAWAERGAGPEHEQYTTARTEAWSLSRDHHRPTKNNRKIQRPRATLTGTGTFVGVVYYGRGLLQTDLTELRKQPKEEQEEEESVSSISSSETMLSQLKTSSAIQAYSRVWGCENGRTKTGSPRTRDWSMKIESMRMGMDWKHIKIFFQYL